MDQHEPFASDGSPLFALNDSLAPSLLSFGETSFTDTDWWLDMNYMTPIVNESEAQEHIIREVITAPTAVPNSPIEIAKKPSKRAFPCPTRAADLKDGLDPTCNDLNATSMSDLRRHLRASHFFIERCAVCKGNILDQKIFETSHGRANCRIAGKQPMLEALDNSYEALFARVAAMSYAERNSPPRKKTKSTTTTPPADIMPAHLRSREEDGVQHLSADNLSRGQSQPSVSNAALKSSYPVEMHTSLPCYGGLTVDRNPESSDNERATFWPAFSAGSVRYHQSPSTQASTPNESGSSACDRPTLSCQLCPSKTYSGLWAQRNLTRHIASIHAPKPVDTDRRIDCSMENCPRTFRREDARLVHERRSHPELERPPPTRRKRSAD